MSMRLESTGGSRAYKRACSPMSTLTNSRATVLVSPTRLVQTSAAHRGSGIGSQLYASLSDMSWTSRD